MPTYKCWYQSGGTYFFTVNLANRRDNLLTREISLLRQTFANVRQRHPFDIDAIVILPEHLHCIWTLPPGNTDFSLRWSRIKIEFTRSLQINEYQSTSRKTHRERGVWQRRFWEHLIRDEDDLNRHVDYIHFNPVKYGLVNSPKDWPYSSFHRYVEQGILEKNWSAARKAISLDMQ